MLRSDLIREFQKKNPELNLSEIEFIVETFFKTIEKALKEGGKVELRGFGTFFVKKIKAKFNSRNPKTSQLIYVPEKIKVRFKTSKKLKELINDKT